MFKGLKRAVKGGISTVAEQGGNLAGKVVGDSADLKDKFTDGAKRTLQGGVQLVEEGKEKVTGTATEVNASEVKEKTKEVAHKVKHHGGWGEDLLGYSDPSKDLRKAVKAKEKAAKKAKKEKKRKGEKTEDLFDPENLAKYKKEIEEKRKLAAAVSPGVLSDEAEESKENLQLALNQEEAGGESYRWKDEDSPDFGEAVPRSPVRGSDAEDKSGGQAGAKTPRDDNNDDDEGGWRRFQELTAGVDKVLREKQEKLAEIKVDSYYQRKKTQVEILEDAKVARPTTLVGKRKKKWVDLDQAGFEEKEGAEDVSGAEEPDDEDEETLAEAKEEEEAARGVKEGEADGLCEAPEVEQEAAGLEQEGEEDENDDNDDDDIFDTAFAEAVVSGNLKLAVIPDSPEAPEEGDDPFDTKFAQDIVEKHEKEKKVREKVESNRVKFGCIAAAADVLTGKAERVDKHAVDHAVRKKRRRANRINLIADEVEDVTALDDIEGISPTRGGEEDHHHQQADVLLAEDISSLEVPVGDLLSSTPSPGPYVQPEGQHDQEVVGPVEQQTLAEDLKEFDVVRQEETALTSNIALLQAEFCEAHVEEADPFDEAFDQLAKESITKTKLEEIEKDLFDEDLFDTSKADEVLRLASLTHEFNKRRSEEQEPEEVELEDFEDKDPFDTSAYAHITKELEDDLEFEALAKRDPHETLCCSADVGPDPFDVIDEQLKSQTASSADQSWAAFEEPRSKPSRPPPPRPAPPRPAPPSQPTTSPRVQVDYASGRNTPSVIVKAPSSESIKSWNVTQAECLILKSNIEAIEAAGYNEEAGKEFDPFDTTEFEEVVAELKAKEVDPFDTSAHEGTLIGPSKTELRLIEKEVLNSASGTVDTANPESNISLLEKELGEPCASEDPFDTGFVKDILPEEAADPFDTSVVDPGLLKETTADSDFDPFDTSIVEKVIPVRKPRVSQRSTISIEDEDFDPSSAFKVKPSPPQRPTLPKALVDPFFIEGADGSSGIKVLTPHKEVQEELFEDLKTEETKSFAFKQLEEELLDDIGGPLKRTYTDEDFDPRALESPEAPADPDEFDPFDTSAIQIQ